MHFDVDDHADRLAGLLWRRQQEDDVEHRRPLRQLLVLHVVGLDALRRGLPRMDGYPADVHLRVRKIFRHDLLDGKSLVFIDEMHQQPGEDLPVAENPLDEGILTKATLEGRRQVRRAMELFKAIRPVLGNVYLMELPMVIGVRETRRIKGEYYITDDDVKEARRHDDGICLVRFGVDIHEPSKATQTCFGHKGFDIPLRSLVPLEVDNLLTAGRCISGSYVAHAAYHYYGGGLGWRRKINIENDLRKWAEDKLFDVLLCGHLHRPFIWRHGGWAQVCAGAMTITRHVAVVDINETIECNLVRI